MHSTRCEIMQFMCWYILLEKGNLRIVNKSATDAAGVLPTQAPEESTKQRQRCVQEVLQSVKFLCTFEASTALHNAGHLRRRRPLRKPRRWVRSFMERALSFPS